MTCPFSFQIKEKRIEDLSDGTKQKVKKKYERIKIQLEKKFAEAIAPGQSDELIVPLKMFRESDALGQILVLAVINHIKYSKETLIRIFGCKKHQIDYARKIQKEKSGLSIPEKKKIHSC